MNSTNTKKTGMVSLIGKTNVGKSTLLNQLVEQKVSITSRKPQTTRQRLLGIKTEGSNQIIYVDTPGFHQGHKRALNKFMNKTALSSIEGVDIVLFVVDALRFSSIFLILFISMDAPRFSIAFAIESSSFLISCGSSIIIRLPLYQS